MAITKTPLTRYKILDICFKNRFKNYDIDSLLIKVNNDLIELYGDSSHCIQKRQLQQDIAFMKSEKGWNIELQEEYDGKKKIYRYSDLNFSINNAPLNDVEISEFQSALKTLSQFEGMPQFNGIQEILVKLRSDLKFAGSEEPFVSFENNQDLKGLQFFRELYDALQNKTTLEVTYKDFKSPEPYTFIFHPHYLKQYNNRWFIFGLHQQTGRQNCNLAIDRIISINASNVLFTKSIINWSDYFSDMIGVSKSDGALEEEIVLQFDELTGKYMENKPIHETQKHKWVGDKFELKIKLIINYELERLILSYGDCVKVIAPDHLKEKIKERLKNALDLNLQITDFNQ